MNSDDQFEQRLRRQTLREVPGGWREEILDAARRVAVTPHAVPSARPSLFAVLNSQLAAWLWPHPKAWAGLAAVWLLILGANFTLREPSAKDFAREAGPPSPQIRELLRQQEQLLAELIGPIEKPEAERPKSPAHQPRSQRREETMNA